LDETNADESLWILDMAEPWKDPAYEPEGARFHEGQRAPLGLIHRLPAAPFEQNINIGGPTYSALPPQRSGLTVDEQNVSSFQMPFGFFQHAIAPGSFSPMHLGWQENIQEAKERDVTPGSWMHRAGTEEWQGGWDALDAALDIGEAVPGGQILGHAADIGKMVGPISAVALKNIRRTAEGSSADLLQPGQRVLESITEGGKFKIQDVTNTSREMAEFMEGSRFQPDSLYFSAGLGEGLPVSHQYPFMDDLADKLNRTGSDTYVFDVLDASDDTLKFRVEAYPGFDIEGRKVLYDAFEDWLYDESNFKSGLLLGDEAIPTMDQLFRRSPWKVDIRGYLPKDKLPDSFQSRDSYAMEAWDSDRLQPLLNYSDTTSKGQVSIADQAKIWEAIRTRVGASDIIGSRLPNEGKGARPQGVTSERLDKHLKLKDEPYRQMQTKGLSPKQEKLFEEFLKSDAFFDKALQISQIYGISPTEVKSILKDEFIYEDILDMLKKK
jgi:hypothetical protein